MNEFTDFKKIRLVIKLGLGKKRGEGRKGFKDRGCQGKNRWEERGKKRVRGGRGERREG